MSKKNDASGSSALRRSTSSLRPKRRIVTWKGSGVPSGGARSAIASPSRIVSRRGSRRVASTTSGTATVTSFSWREKTRTSSPALCTWIRAPSSLYSNAASPSSARASATSAAAWASIGWIGRNSSIRKRASPAAPSTSAARATAARSPASIAARRTKSGSSPAARATASVTSPSSALAQLADQQPEQEFLLVLGRAREQLAQQAVLRLGRALAGGVGEALELGVDLGELYGRCSGRALGPHSLEGGVPDADPSLPGGAREKGDRGFDFLRSGLLQRGGEQVDLREPAARLGDAAGGLDEVVEAHG